MNQQQTISNYLNNHDVHKLHLGCGPNVLSGWLNTDYSPQNASVMFMDASQGFPFEDASFNYIFSEHMIEHIHYQDGISMLRNCFRVLKPNGKIRVTTPNLAQILALYTSDKSPEQQFYIRAITDTYLRDLDQYHETFVINNAFRNWGHLFLYDKAILQDSFERVGFTDIICHPATVSNDSHLQGIECRTDALSIYETMAFEATRP